MAQISITKPIMLAFTPYEQGMLMRALGELKASESRELMNRMETLIVSNEAPPPAPIAEPVPETAKIAPIADPTPEVPQSA